MDIYRKIRFENQEPSGSFFCELQQYALPQEHFMLISIRNNKLIDFIKKIVDKSIIK